MPPVQHAIPKFLELRHEFQLQLMSRVRGNLAELSLQLATQKLAAALKSKVAGTPCFACRQRAPTKRVALDLIEKKGVYVHPGHFYDVPTDGYLIVSLIASEQEFAEGIKRLISIF